MTEWYITDGTKVMMQYRTDGDGIVSQQIVYEYDENDNVVSFSYNNEKYYYQRNGQHDIIGITDGNGTTAGEYEYDSWGKILNESDLTPIARINPYRYRGYRYDEESGFYWLHSRYYDPVVRRFINSDEVAMGVDPLAEILESNLYSYCINDPVNRVDPFGCKSKTKWKSELTLAARVIIGILGLSTSGVALVTISICYGLASIINTAASASKLMNKLNSLKISVENKLRKINESIISTVGEMKNHYIKIKKKYGKYINLIEKDMKKTGLLVGLSIGSTLINIFANVYNVGLGKRVLATVMDILNYNTTFLSYIDVYSSAALTQIIKKDIKKISADL